MNWNTKAKLLDELKEDEIVHWNYRGFVQLPDELREYGCNTKELYVNDNVIISLPKWIHYMDRLTNLYLRNNNLETLPEEIGLCTNLKLLDLRSNCLTSLPNSLGLLSNLMYLNLGRNCLSYLIQDLSGMKNLTFLHLNHNRIEVLPSSVGTLWKLLELQMDENKLKKLPRKMVDLPNLTHLCLVENEIEYLPMLWWQSNPKVCLYNNPRLNYLANEVLPYCEHILINKSNESPELRYKPDEGNLIEIENDLILSLPPLRPIQPGMFAPASLLELSLRAVHNSDLSCLPRFLKEIIESGAVSRCHKCKTVLYTEAVIYVRDDRNTGMLVVTTACSDIRCVPSEHLSYKAWKKL